jgi:hypothetical protein
MRCVRVYMYMYVRKISVNPEYDLKMVQEGRLVAMLSSGNEVCVCVCMYATRLACSARCDAFERK